MRQERAEPVRPLARGTLRLQSDERLLKLFRRGVEAAFDQLVRRYRDALVGYAGSIAGADRAEDVVQESLVKAHRSLKDDRDIEPRPWLYALVRNTALNDIRDNRKHRHSEIGAVAGSDRSPADLAEQRERFAAVLAAVADLPPAQRRALVDHELSGFSHEEIAAELDLSTGATKQLIYRARLSLRNAFGAMIPLPLVAWLAEGSGVIATGAAGGGATATGLLAGLGGGGAAKLAVVAVVAGGSLAGGLVVDKNHSGKSPNRDSTAQAAVPPDSAGTATSGHSFLTSGDLAGENGKGGRGSGKEGSSKKQDQSGEMESDDRDDRDRRDHDDLDDDFGENEPGHAKAGRADDDSDDDSGEKQSGGDKGDRRDDDSKDDSGDDIGDDSGGHAPGGSRGGRGETDFDDAGETGDESHVDRPPVAPPAAPAPKPGGSGSEGGSHGGKGAPGGDRD